LRVFSLKSLEELIALEEEHKAAPHLRIMQKALAEELTTMVHGETELKNTIQASELLFGKAGVEELKALDEKLFLQVFEGVPQLEITADKLEQDIVTFLGETTKEVSYPSKGEARKAIQAGSVTINGEKISDVTCTAQSLGTLHNQYILLRKGKKNYVLITILN